MPIKLHNDRRILLSPLTDNSNNQSWWITICTLILLFILKSVLWLLENADKLVLTLTQAEGEKVKFLKHKSNYAAVGLAFFLGCFGGIGSHAEKLYALRCTLAFLEVRQHDAFRERAGLAQLASSDHS